MTVPYFLKLWKFYFGLVSVEKIYDESTSKILCRSTKLCPNIKHDFSVNFLSLQIIKVLGKQIIHACIKVIALVIAKANTKFYPYYDPFRSHLISSILKWSIYGILGHGWFCLHFSELRRKFILSGLLWTLIEFIAIRFHKLHQINLILEIKTD